MQNRSVLQLQQIVGKPSRHPQSNHAGNEKQMNAAGTPQHGQMPCNYPT
jgi:hypothetical protein